MRKSKYNQPSGVKEPKGQKFNLSQSIRDAIRLRDAEKGTGTPTLTADGKRKATF